MKGEPGIESSGLWDDPGFMACPPLLLASFIKQPSCWFSSGPSQQALAQPRARGQRGFDQEEEGSRLPLNSSFSSIKHHLLPTMRYPQILPVPAKPAGPDRAGERSSLNISQYIPKRREIKKQTPKNAPSHYSKHLSGYPTTLATSITFP